MVCYTSRAGYEQKLGKLTFRKWLLSTRLRWTYRFWNDFHGTGPALCCPTWHGLTHLSGHRVLFNDGGRLASSTWWKWVCRDQPSQCLSCLICVLFKDRKIWETMKGFGAKRLFSNPCQSLSAFIPPQQSRGHTCHVLLILIQKDSSQVTSGQGPRVFSLTNLIRPSIFCCYLIQANTWTPHFRALERWVGTSFAWKQCSLTHCEPTVSREASRAGRGWCASGDFW